MDLDKIMRVTSADALSSDSVSADSVSGDEKVPVSDDFAVTSTSSDHKTGGAVSSKDLPVKGKENESSSDKTQPRDSVKDGYVITISEERRQEP